MAEATSTNNMFTFDTPLEGGDIESGSSSANGSELSIVASLNMADRGNNDGPVVHIDKWVSSLARILEDIPPYMCNPGHPSRISRIPGNLREVDVKAYEPYVLSIGPYHHGKRRLQKMDMGKQLILKSVLEKRPEITLKDYLNEIKSHEPAARSFYSDVEMNSEEFVGMLLLDSLYIITVFCYLPESKDSMTEANTRSGRLDIEDRIDMATQNNDGMGTVEDSENIYVMEGNEELNNDMSEQAMTPRWFWILFMHDIFLLENQVPFFILQKIYALAYDGPETQLICILKDRIGRMLLSYTKLDSEMVISPTKEVHHILHLCHMFFQPTLQQESVDQLPDSSQMFRLGSAVQLYEAGITFEVRSCSSQHSLLDITFGSCGKLVMSNLHVDDNTVSLLRNLIALEQMKYPTMGLNISAYAVFLLHLITVPEDVKLLRRAGIIQHHLASDKEMVYLVNRLSVGLAFDYVEDEYSLKRVFQELKSYSTRRTPRWRAWLEHRYFNNPWTVISLMAATLLLLLTAIQTYYAVYSYYFPYIDGHS